MGTMSEPGMWWRTQGISDWGEATDFVIRLHARIDNAADVVLRLQAKINTLKAEIDMLKAERAALCDFVKSLEGQVKQGTPEMLRSLADRLWWIRYAEEK